MLQRSPAPPEIAKTAPRASPLRLISWANCRVKRGIVNDIAGHLAQRPARIRATRCGGPVRHALGITWITPPGRLAGLFWDLSTIRRNQKARGNLLLYRSEIVASVSVSFLIRIGNAVQHKEKFIKGSVDVRLSFSLRWKVQCKIIDVQVKKTVAASRGIE
jgi:hypothetical protein